LHLLELSTPSWLPRPLLVVKQWSLQAPLM
jgi:hypothetical protein